MVIEALEATGVEYLVGGAVAAWAWGEPRATLDLDVVADIPPAAAERLSAELEARRMSVPAEVIWETIQEDRADLAINAIQLDAGYKAEIFPLRSGDVLRRYPKVLVPEMNLGQLALLLRAEFLVDAASYTRVRGRPLTAAELEDAITAMAGGIT